MTLRFDHAIIAVHDLDTATANYQALGFNALYGGVHTGGTTHNALIYFADGSYLELLAPTGNAPDPGATRTDFSALVAGGEGLIGCAFGAENLQSAAAPMRERGLALTELRKGGRERSDGVALQWESVGIEGSLSPFFIGDVTAHTLRVLDDTDSTAQPNSVTGIAEVHFLKSAALSQRYAQIFGAEQDTYEVSGTIIKLIDPPDGTQPSDAPYALVFAGASTPFDTAKTHGARLHIP